MPHTQVDIQRLAIISLIGHCIIYGDEVCSNRLIFLCRKCPARLIFFSPATDICVSACCTGFSSEEVDISLQSDVLFVNESGVEKSWGAAAMQRDVQNQMPFYVNNETMRKYRYAPLQEPGLKPQQGYWVYANKAGNFTVKGAGGSFRNESYRLTDIMFTNGTVDLNISDARAAGWVAGNTIHDVFYMYDTSADPDYVWKRVSNSSTLCDIWEDRYICDNINSWQGYMIKSNKNNIKLLRQN